MAYEWENYKEEIIECWKTLTLQKMREHFAQKEPPLRASTSAWNNRLRIWGCQKFSHNRRGIHHAVSPTATMSSSQSPGDYAIINQDVGDLDSLSSPPDAVITPLGSEARSFAYLPTQDNSQIDSVAGSPVHSGYPPRHMDLTWLYTLDPRDLTIMSLPNFLLTSKNDGVDFMQRTYSGVTVIQAILKKIFDPILLFEVLAILPSLHVNLYARDRSNWSAMHHLRHQLDNLSIRYDWTTFDQPHIFPTADFGAVMCAEFQYFTQNNMLGHSQRADAAGSKIVDSCRSRNVRSEDENGKTALMCLMLMGRYYSGWHSELLCTQSETRQRLVQECIATGSDVNEYDKDGFTALHYCMLATWKYDGEDPVSIVQLLLEAGANLYLQDRKGDTALHLACASGLIGSTRILIGNLLPNDQTSGVNAKNDEGRSVVEAAYWALERESFRNEELASRIQQCIQLVIAAGGS